MPDIISLLSSSPPASPPQPITSSRAGDLSTAPAAWLKDTNNFDLSDDFDFPIERASKKRKSNDLIAITTASRQAGMLQDEPELELSSDIELPFLSNLNSRSRSVVPFTSVQDCDPVVFSSSAPQLGRRDSKPTIAIYGLSSDSLPDDPFEDDSISFSQPVVSTKPLGTLSERAANLLTSLENENSSNNTNNRKQQSVSRTGSIDLKGNKIKKSMQTKSSTFDEITFSSSPHKLSKKSEKHDMDVATSKAEKAANKELEKQKKLEAKERAARDKQIAADIAEANKSRTNKKDSVAEMRIEICGSLKNTSIGTQLEEHMKNLSVPLKYFDEEVNLTNGNATELSIGSVVRWKRKNTARYDETAGHWLPIEKEEVRTESHLLIHLSALEFVQMLSGGKSVSDPNLSSLKSNIDAHISAIRQKYKENTIVYQIQGLQAWLRKNQTARNREYTAAVRAAQAVEDETLPSTSQPSNKRKSKKSAAAAAAAATKSDLSAITPDMTEDLLLHLQLAHQPIFIHHTTSPATSASQISAFTQHLSTRPYRQAALNHNLRSASFCMDTGQIRTGDNAQETYVKMLQEVQRVTPSMAYGISAAGYGNVRKLVQAFRTDGNLVLEDVRKSANKDGAWSDRRLGPMVSKRLYKVFMGRDPSARDGMA